MTQKSSQIQLPDIKTEGLIIEIRSEMDFCDNPLVFVDMRVSANPILHSRYILSGKGFQDMAKKFLTASSKIGKAYDGYWETKKRGKAEENSVG